MGPDLRVSVHDRNLLVRQIGMGGIGRSCTDDIVRGLSGHEVLKFAEDNPQTALMEGAELLIHEQMKLQMGTILTRTRPATD